VHGTHIYTHTHTQIQTHRYTHTHTLTPTHAYNHKYMHAYSQDTHTLSQRHMHTGMQTHTHTHYIPGVSGQHEEHGASRA